MKEDILNTIDQIQQSIDFKAGKFNGFKFVFFVDNREFVLTGRSGFTLSDSKGKSLEFRGETLDSVAQKFMDFFHQSGVAHVTRDQDGDYLKLRVSYKKDWWVEVDSVHHRVFTNEPEENS
jgi:hypothetical protein